MHQSTALCRPLPPPARAATRIVFGLVLALTASILTGTPASAGEWHITNCAEGQEQWLEYGMALGQTMIVYDVPCTVTLTKPVNMRSGVTITATQPVTFTGNKGAFPGFKIDTRSSVTLRNLTIRQFGDPDLRSQNNPHDCVDILASTSVVLEHLTISECGDKQVSIMNGSSVYLIANHFVGDSAHAQWVQAGAQFYGKSAEEKLLVRSTRNWFDGDGYRMPNVNYGKMHSWNNLFDRPFAPTQCQRGAQCRFENDVWIPKKIGQTMVRYDPNGDGCSEAGLCDETWGAGFVTPGNWILDNADVKSYNPSLVFEPFYRYTAVAADQALVDNIRATAGAH